MNSKDIMINKQNYDATKFPVYIYDSWEWQKFV